MYDDIMEYKHIMPVVQSLRDKLKNDGKPRSTYITFNQSESKWNYLMSCSKIYTKGFQSTETGIHQ